MTNTISCTKLLALKEVEESIPEEGIEGCQNFLNDSFDPQVYHVGKRDTFSIFGTARDYSYAIPLEGCSTQNRASIVYSGTSQYRAQLCADVLKQKTGNSYLVTSRTRINSLFGYDYLLPDQIIYEVQKSEDGE